MLTKELSVVPSLPRLYAKAMVTGFGRGGDSLPEVEVRAAAVPVRAEHLASYDRVCGFRINDTVPATYPHALAFPLAVSLMTDGDFPFPLMGLVHVANRITVHRPIGLGETLDLAVRAENLRPHEKGRQLDIVAEASVNGQIVWRGVSTYLRRGEAEQRGGSGDGGEEPPSAQREPARREAASPSAVGTWRVEGSTGRRYAAVSGDRNPIHLYPLTAKAFGFPRAIAHGMWTKARCLAAFEGRLPEAFTVDVEFRAPVLLPSTVAFSTVTSDGQTTFALHDAKRGRRHLSGTLG